MRRKKTIKNRLIKTFSKYLKTIVLGLAIVFFIVPVIYIALLKYINPPLTPLMLQRYVQGYNIDKQWLDLDSISPQLRFAAIAAEDNMFCRHAGFDFKALLSVIKKALRGEKTAGASTISMQTSKNLLLLPTRSYFRKSLEFYYTIWLELILDKRRILELYLNIIEFGQGVYGVQAATQYYYGQDATQLSRRRASELVTVLPGPLYLNPTNSSKSRRYAQRIKKLGTLLNCVR